MPITNKPLAWILPFLILVSCSPQSEESEYSFRIYEEDGITIAETIGGPKYEGELFEYVEVLKIYPDSTKPDSYLFNPDRVIMGADGNIFISDMMNHRIAVFNPAGEYLFNIGQQGKGPGDLDLPGQMAILGDTLYVQQYSMPARLSIFRTDGSLLDVVTSFTTYRSGSGGITLPYLYKSPDGVLIEHIYHRYDEGPYGLIEAQATIFSTENDTVAILTAGPIPDAHLVNFGVKNLGGKQPLSIPFNGFPVLVYLPHSRVVLSDGIEPIIQRYDLSGVLREEFRLSVRPDTFTPDDLETLKQIADRKVQESVEQYGASDSRTRWAKYERRHLPIPDHKAYWCGLYVDSHGYTWLQIPEAGGRVFHENHSYRYRVLSPRGEYLGDTAVPILLNALDLGSEVVDGFLLGLVRDQETHERIPTIYRIRPAMEGMKYPYK